MPSSEVNPIECPLCKGAGALGRDVPIGHPDFDRIFPCSHPCHNKERLVRLVKVSGLAPQDLSLRLIDFEANDRVTHKVLEAAQSFLAHPCSIFYLHGGPGNGKTLILKALVNEFNRTGFTAVYTSFFQLLWWMRQVFGKSGDRESFLDRYEHIKRVSVLAIDELDKVKQTDFVQEFQFDLINMRYEAGLRGECCTIFASNDPPDALSSYLLSRIRDNRCLVVENKAPDLRPYLER